MRILGLLVSIAVAAAAVSVQADRKTWTLGICKPSTEADQVRVEIGSAGRNGAIKQEWVVWIRKTAEGDVQEYDVPSELSENGRISVQASSNPKGRKAHLAVFLFGKAKKVFDFDGEATHDVSAEDPDVEWRCPR